MIETEVGQRTIANSKKKVTGQVSMKETLYKKDILVSMTISYLFHQF